MDNNFPSTKSESSHKSEVRDRVAPPVGLRRLVPSPPFDTLAAAERRWGTGVKPSFGSACKPRCGPGATALLLDEHVAVFGGLGVALPAIKTE